MAEEFLRAVLGLEIGGGGRVRRDACPGCGGNRLGLWE